MDKTIELIKKYWHQKRGISLTKLLLKERDGIEMSEEEIEKITKGFLEQGLVRGEYNGISEINKNVDSEKKYEISNGYYIFYNIEVNDLGERESIPYPIPISVVDQIFRDYSKHGGNLTGEEILQKYNISIETRNLLKSRLRLFKASNVVSPYTLENIPAEGLEDYIEGQLDETIQDKYRNIFIKKDNTIKKKEFIKYSNFYNSQTIFLDYISKAIENHKPIEVGKFKPIKIKNNDTIDVAFSDIHIGKQGTQGVINRLNTMVEYIKSRKEKNINLLFLGDFAECLLEGGMHPGQVETMDGPFGFDLMLLIVETIENMLIELYKAGKVVRFIGMPGNHGRLGKNHQEDQGRTGALVIFEMIKRGLSNTKIVVEYTREKTHTLYLENFNIVTNHGDEGFDKKAQQQAEKILWNNVEKNGKYSIILYGDKHNVKINEGKGYTAVGLPALAGDNTYDTRLDLHSETGFVVIEKNVHGTADIQIKRL